MKRLLSSLILICVALLLTISLASGIAKAQCSVVITGVDGNSGAGFSCLNTGEDANFCYYDCTCTGSKAICDKLYKAAGLVDP